MPNHITTMIRMKREHLSSLGGPPTPEQIEAHEKEWEEIREGIAKRKGREQPLEEVEKSTPTPPMPEFLVDFEILIPSPPNKEVGGCSGSHEPDVVCWYSWNVDNWGTKWNGYSAEVHELDEERVVLKFETAWSHPIPVIYALSKKHPEEVFDVLFADEDLGYNLGAYRVKDGEILMEFPVEPGSDKALNVAAVINYGMSYDELRRDSACENFTPSANQPDRCDDCWEPKEYHGPAPADESKMLPSSPASLFSTMAGEAPAA